MSAALSGRGLGRLPRGCCTISFKYQFHGCSGRERNRQVMPTANCVFLAGSNFVRKRGSRQGRMQLSRCQPTSSGLFQDVHQGPVVPSWACPAPMTAVQ